LFLYKQYYLLSKSGLTISAWFFLRLFSLADLSAQTEILVLDNEGLALPGAHVTFCPVHSNKCQVVLSDISGKVIVPEEFTSGNSKFVLHIAYVGYLKVTDTLDAGQNISYRMQIDNVTLNQVVITGQYAPNNPEKSVHKVKIITKEQLDARGVVNLNDALQFETNMRISQDNMLGSALTVQGISGENVKIMIDGVPVVGRQDGNIDLNQINMNNIERIEVVEGPLSVNYGTNALAGTINIITKKDQEHTYNTGVNAYYESVGQYNLDVLAGFKKGKHQFSLNLGRNFFNGWSPNESYSFIPKSTPADTNRNVQWNPKEQIYANAQYTLRVNKNTYRLFGDYFNETIVNRGRPRAPYYLTAFDEYYYTKRIMVGADLSGDLGKKSNWNMLISYNDYTRTRYTYFKDLTNLEESLTENPGDHDTTSIKSWMSRAAVRIMPEAKKVNVEVGYDVNQEKAGGKRIEQGEQTMGDYAIFTTAEWTPIKALTVKPGLRYAYNTGYKAPLIPSLNLRYASGRTSYRFSYARGFRSPSLKELYFDFVDINHSIFGNQDIKAESSHNFQMDIAHKRVKAQRITLLEGGLFFNDISDMISLSQVGFSQKYTYVNIGEYRTQGFDLSISQSINHWKALVGMVYTGRLNGTGDSVISSNMYYSPEFRASLTHEFKKIGGNIALYYKYNGRIPVYSIDETGGMSERFSEAYQMIDLAATKYFAKKKLNWTFGIKNLLDVQSISTVGTAGSIHNNVGSVVPISWGRTFFTSVKFNVGWK
jgi:outer membrane receptor for ferrienterochelin and colicins